MKTKKSIVTETVKPQQISIKLDTEKVAEEKPAAKEKVEAAAPAKAAEKKEEPAKTAAKKAEPVKKAEPEKTAKKTETKAAKKPVVKEEVKPEIFVQYAGQESKVNELIEQAKQAFVAEGHRVSSIKSVELYIKPEESAAYYVVNGKLTGQLDLF